MPNRKILSDFKNSLDSLAINQKIALAISGGSDSMAMLIATNKLLKKTDFVAITVDHNLRDGSASETQKVKKWCKELAIEHVILKWDNPSKEGNLQANARNARYLLMSNYCNSNNIKYLFVAHNINDQAETVLMRMLRGSGVDGLSSISSKSFIYNINIVRPFLNIFNDELKQFLIENKQEWIEDPSNNNDDFQRVGIRQIIDKYHDKNTIINRLTETANHMRRASSYINHKIADDLKSCTIFHQQAYVILKKRNFIQLHPEAQIRILSKILTALSSYPKQIRFEKLYNIHQNIVDNKINKSQTIFNCVVQDNGDSYLMYKELSKIDEAEKALNTNQQIIWDNRIYILNKSNVNLTVKLLGVENYLKYLKENEKKLPLNLNKKIIYTLPAIFHLEKLVSVPQIRYCVNKSLSQEISYKFSSKLSELS